MKLKSVKPEHIELVRELAKRYRPVNDASWLDGFSPSAAFLICVAQGPWIHKRRVNVATQAVHWMLGQEADDIGQITLSEPPDIYPLRWQNDHLQSMYTSLWERKTLLRDVYDSWLDMLIYDPAPVWPTILKELFSMCGVPERGTKVLWLFARDFLQIPAFPIDRRVKRVLAEHGLPADSWYITYACEQADIITNELARGMFYSKEDERNAKG